MNNLSVCKQFELSIVINSYRSASQFSGYNIIRYVVYAGTVCACLLLYCYGGTEMSTAVSRSEIGLLYIYISKLSKPASPHRVWSWVRRRTTATGINGIVRCVVASFCSYCARSDPSRCRCLSLHPRCPSSLRQVASEQVASCKLKPTHNLSLSLCLAADYQVYGLHCGAGQDNTLDCVCAACHSYCTYPKSMQHIKIIKLHRTLLPHSLARSISLSLSLSLA